MTTRGHSGSDARICLVARHVYIDVDAVALRTWRVHLLEPEGRPAANRVQQVLIADRLVAEHRAPEGPHFRSYERIDCDLHVLDGGGVGRHAKQTRGRRDLPSYLDVVVAQPSWLVSEEPDSYALSSHVNVDMVVSRSRKFTNCLNQRGAGAERSGLKIRARHAATPQSAPVLHACRLVELLARNLISHAPDVSDRSLRSHCVA